MFVNTITKALFLGRTRSAPHVGHLSQCGWVGAARIRRRSRVVGSLQFPLRLLYFLPEKIHIMTCYIIFHYNTVFYSLYHWCDFPKWRFRGSWWRQNYKEIHVSEELPWGSGLGEFVAIFRGHGKDGEGRGKNRELRREERSRSRWRYREEPRVGGDCMENAERSVVWSVYSILFTYKNFKFSCPF